MRQRTRCCTIEAIIVYIRKINVSSNAMAFVYHLDMYCIRDFVLRHITN